VAYCLNSDVQNEFKSLAFNAATVSTTKVDEWIEQASALMDTILGSQYVTPVTGTRALEVMKMICVWLVADRVREVLQLLPGANAASQEFSRDYFRRANDFLESLRKGLITLPDAVLAGGGSGGISSYVQENGFQPVFQRDKEQW